MAVQPDGKVVVAGGADEAASGGNFALARYNADGSLDTSLSGDGRQTTDFGGGLDHGSGVALQPDGKIVVAGRPTRIVSTTSPSPATSARRSLINSPTAP